jgi:hypothetical protein
MTKRGLRHFQKLGSTQAVNLLLTLEITPYIRLSELVASLPQFTSEKRERGLVILSACENRSIIANIANVEPLFIAA